MGLVDYFLKIDGIEGEATDKKHAKEIDVQSFSFGATQAGSSTFGGGHTAGKVQFQDFHFVMNTNKASPNLFLACSDGSHIKKAVLTCRKAGKTQQEYLIVTFSDLIVSSYQVSGSPGGGILPTDQISLNFAKLEIEYKPQNADGSLGSPTKTGWDTKLNTKV